MSFRDGDAFAAAMAEVAAQRQTAAEQPVTLTRGAVEELVAALRAGISFADRYTGPKKPHGERVPAQALVARYARSITVLEAVVVAAAATAAAPPRTKSQQPKARRPAPRAKTSRAG